MTEIGVQASTSALGGPFRSWSEPRSIDDHVSALVAALSVRTIGAETVPVAEALDRVLVDDLRAPFDLPRFDNSQMDGFALDAAATPGSFAVAGMIAAGQTGDAVEPGTAVPIMTGAPVPPGTSAIIPVEESDGYDSPSISVPGTPAGRFVRPRGSDIAAGDVALPAGAVLGSASLGVLAAFGLTTISVRARPRVLVVTGGDEVAAPGTQLRDDQVFDANAALLGAVMRRCGADVVESLVVDDTVEDFRASLAARVRAIEPDLVITSGGISAGRFEVVQQGLGGQEGSGAQGAGVDLGGLTARVEFGSVAMQPGGPQGVGVLDSGSGEHIPIVCFPGNPVSTWISAHVLLRDAMDRAWSTGRPSRRVTAALAAPVSPLPAKTQLRRSEMDVGTIRDGPTDPDSTRLRVRAIPGTSSHLLATAAPADSLIVVPPGNAELPVGAVVEVVVL
ncbi:gephyrin-like molybdotransferase Glp [Brevibacterium jeotgali]|uniref:Molybdopterin molybdenumtransferase n=1 Tax=Brevibacterium jeotgali TaxID=1262550 RepID=A0A2H1L880_9MICO|nr:gephyrin-like molybdotransferase Glp [Brevibacterium jeotgali]TWC01580.1 molybdopterin molybdochelatase [Brevibacterium jeotgali]SMY13108.1 molybdopterin molybdotransferase [Brevibacterium jeotgali]